MISIFVHRIKIVYHHDVYVKYPIMMIENIYSIKIIDNQVFLICFSLLSRLTIIIIRQISITKNFMIIMIFNKWILLRIILFQPPLPPNHLPFFDPLPPLPPPPPSLLRFSLLINHFLQRIGHDQILSNNHLTFRLMATII